MVTDGYPPPSKPPQPQLLVPNCDFFGAFSFKFYTVFFDYESGYEVSDLLGQIQSERNVARQMGLKRRSVLLGHFERLLCHFHGINSIGKPVIEPTHPMSSSLVKMKMANEARAIISTFDSSIRDNLSRAEQNRSSRLHSSKNDKVHKRSYKYSCHICNKEYSHIANHLKHAHKLDRVSIQQAKRQRQQAKNSRRNNTSDIASKSSKRSLKSCPVEGCSWVGGRFDYHLPKSHQIEKGSDKYLKLIKQ